MKPASRKKFYRVIAMIVSCVVAVGLAEGLASAYVWLKYKTLDVSRLNELDAGNIYNAEVSDEWKGFAELVRPHPWLGIVPSDLVEKRNGKQLLTRVEKFPTARDPKKFTVLLTGGSVAQMMAMAGNGPKTFLEEALERYDFGGREVVVLNAAQGSGCQPRQAIATLLYADIADAVINLDGFNEASRVGTVKGIRYRMDAPSDWFWEFNILASNSYERLGASWQTTQLRRFSMEHNSRLLYLITRLLRQRIEDSAPTRSDNEVNRVPYLLPKGWTEQQNCDFNMGQYLKFIRSIDALAKVNDAKCAFFVQPCPAIGKVLTEEEKRVVGPVDYADVYQSMTDKLLALRSEGIAVESLLDVFANESSTIYRDVCHCHGKGNGYQLMADAIASKAAEMWSLSPVASR